MMKSLVGIMWIVLVLISGCTGNPDAKRLYDDLLSNYNKLVRPVVNVTDALTVKIKLKLSQLIDVNLKNQIMTTNVWVEQNNNEYGTKNDWFERLAVLSTVCSIYREHENLKAEFEKLKCEYNKLLAKEGNKENRAEQAVATSSDENVPIKQEIKKEIAFEGDEEWVIIGSNGTKLRRAEFDAINWKSYSQATRRLLMKFFSRDTLAFSTLTGKPSPAWKHLGRDLKPIADGNFEVTLATKATLNFTGRVDWKPPAIYKSSCEIDVEFFPFDEQTCVMKFGSWTYDGFQVDLRHVDENKGSNVVDIGIDLTEFYTSVEWDILEVPAVRNEKFYTCCDEPYLDITFNITMRRKTLFYTVNLIIPCMGISFLTVLVFYLPSDSGEKVSLSISILLSLTVFFLLLAEIIPPTSLVVPLLGKFVLFTMILDTFSICVTVVVLNVHFRSPQTHVMAPWVRRVFIHILPRLLVMRRPHYHLDRRSNMGSSHRVMVRTCNGLELRDPEGVYSDSDLLEDPSCLFPSASSRDELTPRELEASALSSCRVHGTTPPPAAACPADSPGDAFGGCPLDDTLCTSDSHAWHRCPEVHKAIDGVRFIADHTRREEDSTRVKEDWKYVAMVLDRLFLWIFTLAVLVGTAGIILQAPTLYDDRRPIDVRISEIASTTAKPHPATPL